MKTLASCCLARSRSLDELLLVGQTDMAGGLRILTLPAILCRNSGIHRPEIIGLLLCSQMAQGLAVPRNHTAQMGLSRLIQSPAMRAQLKTTAAPLYICIPATECL